MCTSRSSKSTAEASRSRRFVGLVDLGDQRRPCGPRRCRSRFRGLTRSFLARLIADSIRSGVQPGTSQPTCVHDVLDGAWRSFWS